MAKRIHKHVVLVRGQLPGDITEKISALHAKVVEKAKQAPPSTAEITSRETGELLVEGFQPKSIIAEDDD